jgi:phage major head subunit gpT-like protein
MPGQFSPTNLDILRRTTRADFYAELGVAQQETLWNQIAMNIDSDSDQEVMAFFGAIPKPQRTDRRGGQPSERTVLEDYSLTVINATWKVDVPVHRDTFEDAKLNQITVRAQQQAQSAMSFLDERMTTQMEANANSYDGIAFFGANHDGGTGVPHDNDITTNIAGTPADPTVAEFETAFGDSLETMRLLEDDQNRKANHGELGLVCMVHAAWENVARSVLEVGPVAGQTGNTGVFKARAKVMINPFQANNERFYLFATSRSVKPVIYQKRVDWEFDLITSGNEWDLNDKAHMVSRGRWEFAMGDHKKAVRHILT